MTIMNATTIIFQIPEDAEQLAKFEASTDLKDWRRECTSSIVCYTYEVYAMDETENLE